MVQEEITRRASQPDEASKQNVVYLVGGGLTCASATRSSYPDRMLMAQLCKDTVRKLREEDRIEVDAAAMRIWNELVSQSDDERLNIQEVIDLLESTGAVPCIDLARKISNAFATVLRRHIARMVGDGFQNVAEVILDLHRLPGNPESLAGVITTNYDPLIELAFESTGRPADYGFECGRVADAIPLLKLHGSLDWLNRVPIRITSAHLGDPAEAGAWIGPRRTKLATSYPFNLIWGRAREVLSNADIIRIIGASLLASDWHVVQLLFHVSLFDAGERPIRIEVINRKADCDRMVGSYRMLNMKPFYALDEVVRFHRRNSKWDDEIEDEHRSNVAHSADIDRNPIDYWLQAKISQLFHTLGTIRTPSKRLLSFIDEG